MPDVNILPEAAGGTFFIYLVQHGNHNFHDDTSFWYFQQNVSQALIILDEVSMVSLPNILLRAPWGRGENSHLHCKIVLCKFVSEAKCQQSKLFWKTTQTRKRRNLKSKMLWAMCVNSFPISYAKKGKRCNCVGVKMWETVFLS